MSPAPVLSRVQQRRPAATAIQYTGSNAAEIREWLEGMKITEGRHAMYIDTPLDTLAIEKDDWIVQGDDGVVEVYPPDVYEKRFEALV